MQSRTHGDTTNRIVAALRVVLVGIRIFKPEFKIAPPLHNNGKGAAQSTFLAELHDLGHVPSEMNKMKKPV